MEEEFLSATEGLYRGENEFVPAATTVRVVIAGVDSSSRCHVRVVVREDGMGGAAVGVACGLEQVGAEPSDVIEI